VSRRPLRFGVFLAPFHPEDENPTEQIHRDLELMEHLDRFGYDEAWIGEHHSGGVEIIASPELFIAHAAARTSRLRFGTGVVSLPYHHPLMVADRMLQLDHQTRGRVMLGVGPGQLPLDAHMLGIEISQQRRMMLESLDAIMALLRGERITRKTDWFELVDAKLHLPPFQWPHLEVAVASAISPSGARAAGIHGAGLLSLAASVQNGFEQLPKHWQVCEEKAAEHGKKVDRQSWRLVAPMHIAETREQAYEEMRHGALRVTRYMEKLMGTKLEFLSSHERCIEEWEQKGLPIFGRLTLGTPDDAVAEIERLRAQSGGFGTLLLFGHNCANTEATRRSYEMFARYVMPAVNDSNRERKASLEFAEDKSDTLIPALTNALGAAVSEHERERAARGEGISWVSNRDQRS
jgi:limonene 1,2-monooxygenase